MFNKRGEYIPYRCSTDMNQVTHPGKYPHGTVSFRAKAAVDLDGSKLGCGAGFPNQRGTSLKFDKPALNILALRRGYWDALKRN
jgi:hypothetical protein